MGAEIKGPIREDPGENKEADREDSQNSIQ